MILITATYKQEIVKNLAGPQLEFRKLKAAIERSGERVELIRACVEAFSLPLPEQPLAWKKLAEDFFSYYEKDLEILYPDYCFTGLHTVIPKAIRRRFMEVMRIIADENLYGENSGKKVFRWIVRWVTINYKLSTIETKLLKNKKNEENSTK